MESKLHERYRRLPDDALLYVVLQPSADYSDEARSAAADVLAARGVDLADRRSELEELFARRGAVGAPERAEDRRWTELVGAIAARAGDDVCLVCQDAAPEAELRIDARRLRDVKLVGSTEIRGYDLLPLWVPTCGRCRVEPRFAVARLPGWALVALFLGGVLLPTALGLTGVLQRLPAPLDIAAFLAPTVLVFGLFGLDWLVVSARLGRLWRAHPASSTLAAKGFAPVASRGASMLALYLSQLRDPTSALRDRAEAELVAAGGDEVVAAATSLLGHPHATEPALRILVALRAAEAIPAIRLLVAGRDGEAARAALEALGRSAADPTASLPQARLVRR